MADQARRRAENHFDNETLSRRFADWLGHIIEAKGLSAGSAAGA